MRLSSLFAGTALALACYGGSTFVAVREDLVASRWHAAKDLIYLPSPTQARLLSLGYTNLVADFYWVKALQYFTDPYQSINRYKNLGDYLDVVLGIDPDYEYAYKFAGLSIPYDTGRFQYVNTRRSTTFLERGVERFPNNWELHFFLGYNYLNFHNEPVKAGEQFAAAADLPGSPKYLKAFAARVLAVGGELDRAIEFASSAAQAAQDPEIKEMMEKRLIDLQIEKELRRIEAAAQDFKATNGRWPTGIEELVKAGLERPASHFSIDEAGVARSPEGTQRMILHMDQAQKDFRGD